MTSSDPNRNLLIKITDPDLLAASGGIVQGMSGSPIVQNGRLVGAVTHVLVNDPTARVRHLCFYHAAKGGRRRTVRQAQEGNTLLAGLEEKFHFCHSAYGRKRAQFCSPGHKTAKESGNGPRLSNEKSPFLLRKLKNPLAIAGKIW